MIEIRDYGYNYKIIFNGKKESYIDFYLAMNSIGECVKIKGDIGYKMPKCYLPDLQKYYTPKLIANP